MKRACFILGTVCLLAGGTLSAASSEKANILFILADDQGYGDLACQPHVMPAVSTPNIDRLATQGIRMTQAYANAHICSPSRASLLTGRYAQRFGYYGNADAATGICRHSTNASYPIPKQAGYATACFGKWHLGWTADHRPQRFRLTSSLASWVVNTTTSTHKWATLAFETRTARPRYSTASVLSATSSISPKNFTDRAADFIRRNAGKPFCLYLAYNAIHGPRRAPESYLARQNGGKEGRDKVRAMVEALDDNVGRVLHTLDELKLANNTLVFYFSDNGGVEKVSDNWKLRGSKGHFFEGGIREPCIVRWPARLPAGKVYEQPVMGMDALPTFLAAAGLGPDPNHPLDGVNLLPYWLGEKTGAPHEALHWAMQKGSTFAVRRGDWKYVRDRDGEGLFNLTQEVSETTDLRAREPRIAEELLGMHAAWLRSMAPRKGKVADTDASNKERSDRRIDTTNNRQTNQTHDD